MDDISFFKVDAVDENQLSDKYSINSVPTIVLIKDGKEIARREGLLPKLIIQEWINISIENN